MDFLLYGSLEARYEKLPVTFAYRLRCTCRFSAIESVSRSKNRLLLHWFCFFPTNHYLLSQVFLFLRFRVNTRLTSDARKSVEQITTHKSREIYCGNHLPLENHIETKSTTASSKNDKSTM
ncbi:uncharacterized protein LOC143258158 [Tachypleus tridentatus]|uniref:uncharacterized protein LOC143258158 n=1 Tax=Tachypleus tridentatus TaxID=6853 RepID=UPI003FD0109F